MILRVFSDIHWEFQRTQRWQPKPMLGDEATTLVLAGDLLPGLASLKEIAKFNRRFKHVVVVLGNHDLWGQNIDTFYTEYAQEIKRLELDNVYLLQDNHIELDGVVFVGGTLWTDMGSKDWLSTKSATGLMARDFDSITNTSGIFSVVDWLDAHDKTCRAILKVLEQATLPVVVVTHHGCSLNSVHERFKHTGFVNNYFVSDLGWMFNLYEPAMWIHGHVHNRFNYSLGSTQVVVNPLGYPSENKDFFEESAYVL